MLTILKLEVSTSVSIIFFVKIGFEVIRTCVRFTAIFNVERVAVLTMI